MLSAVVLLISLLRPMFADICAETYTCDSTCYTTQTYYRSCGFFGWSRCRRYRSITKTCSQLCYRDTCCPGYIGSSCDTPLCFNSTSCQNGGSCIAPDKCTCPTGYFSPSCDDIDECATASHGCSESCINTQGSYHCSCRTGFTLDTDGSSCLDEYGCRTLNGQCEANCSSSGDCQCPDGYAMNQDGATCKNVECGDPGSVSDGTVVVSSTRYGGTAEYTCNEHYNLTGGESVRICQDNYAWSGLEPKCVMVKFCDSSPCKNGATCDNYLGGFECHCADGWSGRTCDTDIQPPLMENCLEDTNVNATELTVHYTWTTPTFTDPMNGELKIVSNYPIPEYTFPWGDFTFQYVATKVSNGLSTECKFRIKVRPTPCEDLNVPRNGALLCNGWKTDYGRICMVTCHGNFSLTPPHSFYTLYVCGASGNWIASNPVPDCDLAVDSEEEALVYQPEYVTYSFSSSCNDDVTKDTLRSFFVEQLENGDFSAFCSKFGDECAPKNVDVKCGN